MKKNTINEKIVVAHIVGKWFGGGVEAVIMNYYRNINRNKIQFHFICDNDSTNIPYDEIEKLGGKVILIPPYQNIFQYNKELTKVFKEKKYKIVHSHINTLSIFPLRIAKKCGISIRIAHSHSTTNKKEWKKNVIKQFLRPFSTIYANRYMCCSELAGRWLFGNKTYNTGKVYLLNNAIDIDKFRYNENVRKIKRKELNISNNALVIGHIGRFAKQKNHDFLIDIFNEIHKCNDNSILLLIGQGELLNEIKGKVKKLNLEKSVKFLGQRLDVNEIYQVFDIFIMPSLYEGLPVVGVEAQISGVLTIFSNNITKEAKILANTKFVSLTEPATEWRNIIMEELKSDKRDKNKECKNSAFDIANASEKLLYYYYECLGV